MTPYETLTKFKPCLADLHVWGQKVWVHDPNNSKLGGGAKEAGGWASTPRATLRESTGWTKPRSVLRETSNSMKIQLNSYRQLNPLTHM